jgi:phospholipid/cholesterol/gamma-HCH transport system substrate-binding protein
VPQVTDRRRLLAVAALIALVLLTVLAWKRPNPLAHVTTVRAAFTDASGLAPVGADVRMAGVVVGHVTGRARHGNSAIVTMTVQHSAGTIRDDATAQLRPRLIFEGTAYVELSPGTPSAPPLGDHVIPTRTTHSYVSLTDALSVLDPPTQASLSAGAYGLRAALSPAARRSLRRAIGTAPAVSRALDSTSAAALGPHGNDLARSVAGFSRISAAVAAQRQDLVALARRADATGAALTPAGGALGATLTRLPATVGSLRTGATKLAGTLARLRALATISLPAGRQLAPTLDAVQPLLTQARAVVAAAGPLLGDADAALRSARAGAPSASRAVAAAKPTVGIYTNGLLDALERPTSLGTPAYLAFLGLFAGGGGASRPYTTTPAAGHFMRFGFRFLTGVGQPLPPCSLLAKANAQVAAAVAENGGCQQ